MITNDDKNVTRMIVIKEILVKGRNYAHDNTIIFLFYRNNTIGILLGLFGYMTKMDDVINTTLFIIFF
jgi:prephenate dehydratase